MEILRDIFKRFKYDPSNLRGDLFGGITAMIPRGEVGLIFAELGRESGILNNEIYAGKVIVIALTTVLSPFAMKRLHSRFNDRMLPYSST